MRAADRLESCSPAVSSAARSRLERAHDSAASASGTLYSSDREHRHLATEAQFALIGFGQMAAMFLTSSTTAVLVSAVLPAPAQGDVNWITWAVYGSPLNAVLCSPPAGGSRAMETSGVEAGSGRRIV